MSAPRVVAVASGSPAARAGLQPGDEIIAMDGQLPRDIIEYQLLADQSEIDLDVRMREEGRPAFRPLINVHEFDGPRVVLENDQVRVTSTLVDHYTIKPAFAYRFETRDRTVVFSGDTRYYEPLATFAKGADVLVHEVMYLPALEKLIKTADNAPTLRDHLLRSHTTTEQVGKIAAAAGVKTLVLSHFVPGADPSVTDDMWAADVRKDFNGQIVVGGSHFLDPSVFGLARIDVGGSLDNTFGDYGTVLTTLQGDEGISAILIQPDGKILAAGSSEDNSTGITDVAIVRCRLDASGERVGPFAPGEKPAIV